MQAAVLPVSGSWQLPDVSGMLRSKGAPSAAAKMRVRETATGGENQSALFASLYDELRHMARRELRRGVGLTLSATTLLHETYCKLHQSNGTSFPDEARFLAYASRAMRTLVIDYARSRQAQKRGGGYEITSLPTDLPEAAVVEVNELERLSVAIDTLAQLDPSLAQLVDLKFFCGYSLVEIAAMRGISERTAQREWDKARVLLKRTLEGQPLLPPSSNE
jgi:RNA polymerase sigma factor (TIGR02999 family)